MVDVYKLYAGKTMENNSWKDEKKTPLDIKRKLKIMDANKTCKIFIVLLRT